MEQTKKVYMCGTHWNTHLGLLTVTTYNTIEGLKSNEPDWSESGIVEVDLNLVKWIEPQDLTPKKKIRRSFVEIAKDIDAVIKRKPSPEKMKELFDALEKYGLTEKK